MIAMVVFPVSGDPQVLRVALMRGSLARGVHRVLGGKGKSGALLVSPRRTFFPQTTMNAKTTAFHEPPNIF
jgi:hypothetical protein